MVGRDSVEPTKLRIGCVKYLNARPLIDGWDGSLVLDHPSALCAQLARGELDVGLVSSFEFLRNPIYRIVDGVAIASDGPVYSVVVACSGASPMVRIEMDPASATSVALLRCLMAERGTILEPVEVSADLLSPLGNGIARMLIGDNAIRFRQKFGADYKYWDLGEQWKSLTKLPFVYALWLIRPEVGDPGVIADRLRALRDHNLRNLDKIIAAEPEFSPEFCRRYYREHLRFNFGSEEQRGLRAFAELCRKHELLPKSDLVLDLV